MYTRLADELLDHRKLIAAGKLVGGYNGQALAGWLYVVGLLWSNKHLTDGWLPMDVVCSFRHVRCPRRVASMLVRSGLWEERDGGFMIHDFHDWNPSAARVKSLRAKDKERKLGKNGHGES